jgi:hypothetical protein
MSSTEDAARKENEDNQGVNHKPKQVPCIYIYIYTVRLRIGDARTGDDYRGLLLQRSAIFNVCSCAVFGNFFGTSY